MAVGESPRPATYYVDGQTGSDGNSGSSRRQAWQSIARVNQMTLAPGDKVLFAGNQTFPGTLTLGKSDSGSLPQPIIVSSFGKGRATVDGGVGDGVALTDCGFVVVQSLNVIGCGRKNGSNGAGIRLTRTDHVKLDGIEVSGFRSAGVFTRGDADTRITRVHAHDNGFAGITTSGGGGGMPRARNLYIGDCIADNNPGDPKNLTNHSGNGIVVGGLDGALIEYCEASNNGWDMPRQGNGPVGIWGFDCDRLTIQHCISRDNKSPGDDGGGFDFDGGVTNSVMQYNLSYDNAGCGYLLCQYPGASPWHTNVVRYNISINDGRKNYQSGIGLWLGGDDFAGAAIYNNTIINPAHAVATIGDVPQMVYRNNIFISGGEILSGNFGRSRFENNLYWSGGRPESVSGQRIGVFADPQLIMPGPGQTLPTDPQRLAAMPFFRLRPDSPARGAGEAVADDGGQDLFGHHRDSSRRPSLGAAN